MTNTHANGIPNTALIDAAPLRYAAMHTAFRLNAEVLCADGAGLLLYRNGQHFLAGEVDLTPFLPGIQLILVHDAAQVSALFKLPQFSEVLTCVQAAYLLPEPPPEGRAIPGLSFRVLNTADYAFVHAHYHTGGNSRREYVMERLTNGDMLGAFVFGAPAGFIGIHREGAMGMLEVSAEYRRRGLGYALERELIRRMLEKGLLPYCHVFPDNESSLSLQKKLRLSTSPEPVYWVC